MIAKFIGPQNERRLPAMPQVYGNIVEAGLHVALDIQTAEAAKAIENGAEIAEWPPMNLAGRRSCRHG